MKVQKNLKKFKNTDATLEFYSNINEIRDLYQNKGYMKAKSLYLHMKDKYKWQMSYISFTLYFNKEIKIKNQKIDTKEKQIIDNNYQLNNKEKKDGKEQSTTKKSFKEETIEKYGQKVYDDFIKQTEAGMDGIRFHIQKREEQKLLNEKKEEE